MSNEASLIAEVVRWAAGAALICAGWYVVHRLSEARDMAASRREFVAAAAGRLTELVDKLFEQVGEYHRSRRDVVAEVRIKIAFKDLAMNVELLSELPGHDVHIARVRSTLVAFRRAATGEHFEDEHVDALLDGDQLLLEVGAAADTLKRSLSRLRFVQFLKSG